MLFQTKFKYRNKIGLQQVLETVDACLSDNRTACS